MHSQEFGNEEARSSDPLAVAAIIPGKVQHDGREQIVIAFNHHIRVRGKGHFVVDFVGTAGAFQVYAQLLNSSALILETPEYPEAGVVTANIYYGIHRQFLGQHSFEFLSRNDTFYRLLYGALDPVRFMCESLQISPAQVEGLDSALADTFKANAPEGFDLLGLHRNVAGDSSAEHPTLLHFAAEFGLSRLISNLLHYPGAREACKIRNYHGHWPYNIAENHGFCDLADKLRCFRDQDPDQIYTDMAGQDDETSYYVKMQKNDGSYYYVSMDGEGHELYVDMHGKRYINLDKQEEEECYLMKKRKDDGSYYYVPMKGDAGPSGKLYEDVKKEKRHRPVPIPPESGQGTSEDLYENYNAGPTASNDQDGELYEAMERNPELEDNAEELYMDMEKGENPSELYIDMEPAGSVPSQYVHYDRPKSNLPVNPDPGFYRSASDAAAVRAKEIEKERERKTLSLPPQIGGMSQMDIIQNSFRKSVAEGRMTMEEAADILKKMGISSQPEPPAVRPRMPSTGSKSSTSTTSSSSSGISIGHELTPREPEEPDFEEEEPIHGNLQTILSDLKQKPKSRNDDIRAQPAPEDVPPPVPRPDYDKAVSAAGPKPRTRHQRAKTTPVRQEDLQPREASPTPPPPPVSRRNSEPLSTAFSVPPPKSPTTRPPASIPEDSSPRPPSKSPPPPVQRRPMQTPPYQDSRPPAPLPSPLKGIPVFPEAPAPPPPQRQPRPAPRSTQK